MKLSLNWLSDYLSLSDFNPSEVIELVTTRVAEVDGFEVRGAALGNSIAAKVLESSPHPKRESLSLLRIQTGSSEVVVVCGDTTVRVGETVAYLPPGGRFKKGDELVEAATRPVAGIESAGLLLSEVELDIGPEGDRVRRLSDTVGAGTKLSKLFGGADTVFEVDNKSLTHRPDLWSHFGFARELKLLLNQTLIKDCDRWADDSAEGEKLLQQLSGADNSRFEIQIQAKSHCSRFAAVEISGVKTLRSPEWMRRRLYTVGGGLRNLLVDVSNYVVFDIGHPNHSYDSNRLSEGTIYVRFARAGETLLALDGSELTLTDQDLIIADNVQPVALAGVIGGSSCSVHDDTTSILLESACFDPVAVRRTAKRYELRTDAAVRFEKTLSPYSVPLALHRTIELLKAECPNLTLNRAIADSFPERPKKLFIDYSPNNIRARLGRELPDGEILRVLTELGGVVSGTGERLKLEVPYYRATRDLSIEQDLVEEVGRITSYQNISPVSPEFSSLPVRDPAINIFERKIRELLRGCGAGEVYNYSFVSREWSERCGYSVEHAVELANPIDQTTAFFRTSLVPNILVAIEENFKHASGGGVAGGLSLFELGRGAESSPYRNRLALRHQIPVKNPPAYERRLLSLAFSAGDDDESAPLSRARSFFSLRVLIERVASLMTGSSLELTPLSEKGGDSAADFHTLRAWMHPGRAAALIVKGETIGVLAEVVPTLLERQSSRVAVCELDLELLLELEDEQSVFQEPGRFPESLFEISIVVDKRVGWRHLEELVRMGAPDELLRRVELFDLYEGAPLKPSEKSVSIRLVFGSNERTLDTAEIKAIQTKVMAAVATGGYHLRA